MLRQLNFVRDSKTLGFNKENLLVIHTEQIAELNRDYTLNYVRKIFADKIKQHSNVIDVTSTRYHYSFWERSEKENHPSDDKKMRSADAHGGCRRCTRDRACHTGPHRI